MGAALTAAHPGDEFLQSGPPARGSPGPTITDSSGRGALTQKHSRSLLCHLCQLLLGLLLLLPLSFPFPKEQAKTSNRHPQGPGTLQPEHPSLSLRTLGPHPGHLPSAHAHLVWAAARSLVAGDLVTGEECQHSPESSSQVGLCLPSVAICKDPKDPLSFLPSLISPHTHAHANTHTRMHAHTHLVRTRDLPQPPSSRVNNHVMPRCLLRGRHAPSAGPPGLGSLH